MNRNRLTFALCLWGAVALASPPNPEDVAKRLVQSTGIAQGDLVRISGSTKDLPLLTAIALEVQKAGGASFFDLTSDESVRRICHEVPAERDAGNASATLKLISAMTADISVSPGTNPQLCSDVDPARLAARGKAFQEANAAYTKGGLKAINLGNGMEPADWRAKRFGITPAQLSSLYWNGINVEPAKLKESATPIVRGLAGKRLTVTAANGTTVSMSIEGRPVLFSDGQVTAEMAKKGQTLVAWLPAGDVYLVAVPGSAEGTVVVDRFWYHEQPIDGLTLTIKGGKIIAMQAKSGPLEQFKRDYEGSGGAKDAVGVVNIGTNPNLRPPAGSRVNATPVWGMVSIMAGDTSWAGGSAVSSWNFIGFVPAATVTVDGKILVDKGQLRAPAA
jgi:leucyl aminopeptidase (aminopeptidase T)